jgi:hypothetical protein
MMTRKNAQPAPRRNKGRNVGTGNGKTWIPGGGDPKLDPILQEIMHHKVKAIADEICITLLRTSRSVFVNEAADFAVGMLDLDGEIFGWAPENQDYIGQCSGGAHDPHNGCARAG